MRLWKSSSGLRLLSARSSVHSPAGFFKTKLRFCPYSDLVMIYRTGRTKAGLLFLITAAIATGWAQQAGTQGPVVITLDEAIHRAQANEPAFAASAAESKAAALDRSIAKAAMLPSVLYHNQILYTQANGEQNQAGQGVGSQPSPRFIANNAVREYASQGVVSETVGLAQMAEIKRTDAAAAFAQAQLEVARRGLVETVVILYYGSEAADRKLDVARRALAEADAFTDLTSAFAALKQSDVEVLAARAAYLPDLGLNFTYGIDAPQFAVNGPDGVRNLGYSASITLDIPVWDWL